MVVEHFSYSDHHGKKKRDPWRGNYGRRKRRKTPKVAILLCFLLAAALLLRFDVIPAQGLNDRLGDVASTISSSLKEAAQWGEEKIGFSEDASFSLPVSCGVVVEEFGVVLNDEGEENYHGGVDIRIPDGSEILAAETGEVTAVDTHDDGTYWITLKHNGDWSTVYGRLGETGVAVGDTVEKGASLGKPKGDTLHFEVLQNGEQKDPVAYFNVD